MLSAKLPLPFSIADTEDDEEMCLSVRRDECPVASKDEWRELVRLLRESDSGRIVSASDSSSAMIETTTGDFAGWQAVIFDGRDDDQIAEL